MWILHFCKWSESQADKTLKKQHNDKYLGFNIALGRILFQLIFLLRFTCVTIYIVLSYSRTKENIKLSYNTPPSQRMARIFDLSPISDGITCTKTARTPFPPRFPSSRSPLPSRFTEQSSENFQFAIHLGVGCVYFFWNNHCRKGINEQKHNYILHNL